MKVRMLLFAAVAIALAGCSTHHTVEPSPRVDFGDPREPAATSPVSAVKRLAWCCNYASVFDYETLFTMDFSTGSVPDRRPDPPPPWGYEDELQSALHLLAGGGALPRPFAYQVVLEDTLVDTPDPRPGKTAAFHRVVRAIATVELIPDDTTVVEYAGTIGQKFYLVRGDSAAIAPELLAQGVRPDSTRWWIERWEEGLGQAPPQRNAGGPLYTTWLAVRQMYRASASTRAARASR